MESFEHRLVEEYKELADRIEKLEAYMDTIIRDVTISNVHYRMVITQYNIMLAYEQILRMRLEDLEVEY